MLLQSFQIIWNIAKLKSINLQYNTVLTKYSDSLFKSGEKKFEYPDKSEMIYLKLFSKLLLIQDIVWLVLLIYWKSQVFDASKRINIIPFKKIQNNYRVFENDIVTSSQRNSLKYVFFCVHLIILFRSAILPIIYDTPGTMCHVLGLTGLSE